MGLLGILGTILGFFLYKSSVRDFFCFIYPSMHSIPFQNPKLNQLTSSSLLSVGQLLNSPRPNPKKLKRCTSSQELLNNKDEQQQENILSSFSSMPNINNEEEEDAYPLMQLADQYSRDGSITGSKVGRCFNRIILIKK